MSAPSEKPPVKRDFFATLGFDLPDDACGFYVSGTNITFVLQIMDEIGCDFRVQQIEETFPLNSMQQQMIKKAGYEDPDGYMIL